MAPDPDPLDYIDDMVDEDEDDDLYDPGEECGRWLNGRLTSSCTKFGSEECDWECPHRGSLLKRNRKR